MSIQQKLNSNFNQQKKIIQLHLDVQIITI